MAKQSNDFWPWLGHTRKRLLSVWASLGISVLLATGKQIYDWLGNPDSHLWAWVVKYAAAMPSTITFLAICVLVLVGWNLRSPHSRGALERSHEAVKQFHYLWVMQWCLWLCLYGLLAFHAILQINHPETKTLPVNLFLSVAEDVFSNAQTTLFVICYLVLSRETLAESAATKKFRPTKFWMPAMALLVMAIFTELVAASVIGETQQFTIVTRSLIGLASAVGMAMFVGRLESRFFGAPASVIVALYFYAALQVFYVLFELPQDEALPEWVAQAYSALMLVKPIVVALALPLKVLLFLVVYWALTTGRLLFYFEEFLRVIRGVDGKWKQFQDDIV